jgi:integrase
MKLTDRSVATIKATDHRLELPDDKVAGLALRVTPSGVKTWALRFRVGGGRAGRLRRLTLGAYPRLTLQLARKEAQKALRQVDGGVDPAAAKQAGRLGETVGDLAKEFLTRYAKPRKRSWREDQRYLDAEVLPAWRHRKVKDVSRRDVRELIAGIADRGSPVSANRCLGIVRKMLNWAVSEEWIDANPAALMPMPSAEQSRERVLNDDEIRLVWAASVSERPAMCALMRLRLLTAQRGKELAHIKWTDIEGDWLTLPSTITKNKKAHRVFLTKDAQALITAQPRLDGCDLVFPGRTGTKPISDARKAGQRIRARVLATLRTADPAIESFDFRGHDLRRTASTKMAEAGISQADISRVLNHVEGGPVATKVYVRYQYDREKQIALETWGRALTGILANAGTAAKVVPITRAQA